MRVFVMAWEEKESGWGLRPDGWSAHGSAADYERYLEVYWAGVPEPLPREYSRPLDQALIAVEIADDHPLARRVASEGSVRINHYADERYELERITGLKWPGAET